MNTSRVRRLKFVAVMAGCIALGGCAEKPVVKGPIPPGQYVVLEGDDLNDIALRAYGDTELWFTLLNANPQLTTRPRFTMQAGESIEIPEREKLDKKLPKSIFPKQLPADYIIMPGDSLHFIAKGCYGDRELWPLIYEANRDKLSERVKEDTRRIFAGEVLHIPAKAEQEDKMMGQRTGAIGQANPPLTPP